MASPVKLFRASSNGLEAVDDWRNRETQKVTRGLYIKKNGTESLYRFGISDTIELPPATRDNPNKFVSVKELAIPDFKPSSFEISELTQKGVDWKLEGSPTPDQLTRSWFVMAKGNEVPPPEPQPTQQIAQQPTQKSFKIIKTTLKIDWKKDESKIIATLTISDGGIKPEPDAIKLKSIEELNTQVKDSELTFDLILKRVELKWDNNREVEVKTPLKIRFVKEKAK